MNEEWMMFQDYLNRNHKQENRFLFLKIAFNTSGNIYELGRIKLIYH